MSTTTTNAEPATPVELVPGFSPGKVRDHLALQLEELRKAYDATYDLQRTLNLLLDENPWPEGATLPNVDRFDMEYHVLHVKIPPPIDPADPSANASASTASTATRPWRGLNGTAGIVYRLRKFFKIAKLERANTFGDLTAPADGSAAPPVYTQFFGFTTFGQPPEPNQYAPTNRWSVYIYVDGQMPPTCRLEEVFGVDPTPRKHYRVVCK